MKARRTARTEARPHPSNRFLHNLSPSPYPVKQGFQRGGMRMAPSSRMVSPLSIGLPTMCATRAANSVGSPSRAGCGTWAPSASRASSGRLASRGVSNSPGAIVTTRIRLVASSRAIGSVMPTTPPFEAEYAACPICPSYAAIEAVFTMTPRSSPTGSWRAIRSAASRSTLNVPIRLTVTTLVKSASGNGPFLPTTLIALPIPAQLTATRSAPSRSAASSAAPTCASSVTSAGENTTRSPSCFATCSPSELGRSTITTPAPAPASVRAGASPRPEAPPVTTATLPAMSMCPVSQPVPCPEPGVRGRPTMMARLTRRWAQSHSPQTSGGEALPGGGVRSRLADLDRRFCRRGRRRALDHAAALLDRRHQQVVQDLVRIRHHRHRDPLHGELHRAGRGVPEELLERGVAVADVRGGPAHGAAVLGPGPLAAVGHVAGRGVVELRQDPLGGQDRHAHHPLPLGVDHRQRGGRGPQRDPYVHVRVVAGQPDHRRDQYGEPPASDIGGAVVDQPGQRRQQGMGARRVVAPAFPGEEGREFHEAGALARIAVLASGQHRNRVGRTSQVAVHRTPPDIGG